MLEQPCSILQNVLILMKAGINLNISLNLFVIKRVDFKYIRMTILLFGGFSIHFSAWHTPNDRLKL